MMAFMTPPSHYLRLAHTSVTAFSQVSTADSRVVPFFFKVPVTSDLRQGHTMFFFFSVE